MSEKKGLPPIRPDNGTIIDRRFGRLPLFRIFAKNWSPGSVERPILNIFDTSDGRLGVSRVDKVKTIQERVDEAIEIFIEEGDIDEEIRRKCKEKKDLTEEEYSILLEAVNEYLKDKGLPPVEIP